MIFLESVEADSFNQRGRKCRQYYADAFRTFPDTELVALVEPNPQRGSAVCEKFGIPAHFSDMQLMLKEARPEVRLKNSVFGHIF